MALKCWKEKKQKRQKLWINKSRKESVVVSDISALLPKYENYQTFAFKGAGKSKLLAWKTGKNKAIKKAKSYMSKHDKCKV